MVVKDLVRSSFLEHPKSLSFTFDVSMYNWWVLSVEVVQALQDTFSALLKQRPNKWPKLFQQGAHRTTWYIFQVNVEAILFALKAQTCHDIWTAQILADPQFGFQAFPECLISLSTQRRLLDGKDATCLFSKALKTQA